MKSKLTKGLFWTGIIGVGIILYVVAFYYGLKLEKFLLSLV